MQTVGWEAARNIADEFGGERLEIPKGDGYWRHVRNQRMRRERAQGATRAELAARYHLTERQVTNILREGNSARTQTGFDW